MRHVFIEFVVAHGQRRLRHCRGADADLVDGVLVNVLGQIVEVYVGVIVAQVARIFMQALIA